MKLLDYLDPALIQLNLEADNKDKVLASLVDLLVAAGTLKNRDDVLSTLQEREGLGSTGIGHGVAIPHGKSAEIQRTAVAIACSREGVDFEAIDGQPTRIFFLLVAPENGANEHLHLLAKISRLMRDAGTREKLLSLDSPDQVLELLGRQDSH